MKKLNYILTVLIAFFIGIGITGCHDNDKPIDNTVVFRRGNYPAENLKLYNIKGHQYIGSLSRLYNDVITHDPDCPLCRKRTYEETIHLIDSITNLK